MTQTDSITEFDLQAYVDGQLDDARRVEVEDYLSRHPEAAAEVMAALRTRDALRLFSTERSDPSSRLIEDAVRLQQGLKRQAWQRKLLRFSGLAAGVLAGWVVITAVQPFGSAPKEAATPAFVDHALDAQRALKLRQRMDSQAKTRSYDPEEIRNKTDLTLPELPRSWKVRDVQIYPWDEGYSVGVTAVAGDLGTVTLFVAPRRPTETLDAIRTTILGDVTAAFWQSGELAYALIGEGTESKLRDAAWLLSSSLEEALSAAAEGHSAQTTIN